MKLATLLDIISRKR